MLYLFILFVDIKTYYEKNIKSISFKNDSILILNCGNNFVELNINTGQKTYSQKFDFKIQDIKYNKNYFIILKDQIYVNNIVKYDPILNSILNIVPLSVINFTIDENGYIYYVQNSYKNFIYRVSIEEKNEAFFIFPFKTSITKLEYSLNNLYVFTNEGIYVLDIKNKKIIDNIKNPHTTTNFAVSYSGEIIALDIKTELQNQIIFKSGNSIFPVFKTNNKINDFKFSRDGKTFAVLTDDRKLTIFQNKDTFVPPEYIKCSSCNFENNKWDFKFCIKCGKKLEDDKKILEINFYEKGTLQKLKEAPYEEITEVKEKKIEKIDTTSLKEKEIKETRIEEQKPVNIIIQPKPKKPMPFIRTPNFFEVPKSEILRQFTMYFSGGSSFSTEEEGRSTFGISEMGFGDLFQIEFSSLGLISSISRGSMLIPALGFKYNLTNTIKDRFNLSKNFPSIALGVKSSWWNRITKDTTKYDIRHSYLFFSFQEDIGIFTGVFGLNVCDTRIKTSKTPEVVTNPILLFTGFELKVNDKSYFELEASQLSGYRLNPDGRESEDDLVIGFWLALGGKCYVFNWLIVNAGVRFDSPEGIIKWSGPADAKLWAGINLLLPLDYYWELLK
uniref:Zinc ribbon domain-containing protein n=1 Tax=candidate division WOR-3 bacterium TaxID=2052148 RepID=A0A7C4U9R0_UNCW3